MEISDSDDVSISIGDPVGKKSGLREVTGSIGSLQIHGERTTEAVKQGESSLINLSEKTLEAPKRAGISVIDVSDHENVFGRRKLRKLGACSVVHEADVSSPSPW